MREDGPLYFRGVRTGDVIQRLRWATDLDAAGNVQYQSAEAPDAMLKALRELPWDTVVAFDYARGRTPARAFQIRPAWQQLVSLVVAETANGPTGRRPAITTRHSRDISCSAGR